MPQTIRGQIRCWGGKDLLCRVPHHLDAVLLQGHKNTLHGANLAPIKSCFIAGDTQAHIRHPR